MGMVDETAWEEYLHGGVADENECGAEVTVIVEEMAWDTGEVTRPSTAADKRSVLAAV